MGIMYACMGIFHFLIGIGIVIFASGPAKASGFVFIFMPIIGGIFGFIGIALVSFVYNLIASMVGGIEFELTDENSRLESSEY